MASHAFPPCLVATCFVLVHRGQYQTQGGFPHAMWRSETPGYQIMWRSPPDVQDCPVQVNSEHADTQDGTASRHIGLLCAACTLLLPTLCVQLISENGYCLWKNTKEQNWCVSEIAACCLLFGLLRTFGIGSVGQVPSLSHLA